MDFPDGRSLTDALSQTLAAAKRVEEIQNAQSDHEPIEVQAAEGKITVTAKLPGTIDLLLDARALRLGSEVLSEEITQAVNAALTQLRESVGAQSAVDLQEVAESLGELQQQSAQRMTTFMDGLMSAHARAAEREGN